MEIKELIGRQGVKPMSSLGGACPCRMCGLLIAFSDLVYCLMLRIDGHGIQKVSIARRVALRLRDIGLLRSARYLENKVGKRRGRGPSRESHPELDLLMPKEFSSVSVESKGAKSFMHEKLLELEDLGRPSETIGRRLAVGDDPDGKRCD